MDEVIRSDIHYQEHTGEITHKQTQPTEDLILNRNAELRKNPGVIRDLSFGRNVASIPFIMYEAAIRAGYELTSGDAEYRSKELFRYLKTEEGKKCLVQG